VSVSYSLVKKQLILAGLILALSAIGAHAQDSNSKPASGNEVIRPPVRSKTVVRGRAIFDDTGLPAVAALVRLLDPKSPRPMGGMTTNDRGGFGLGGIPPGEYYLIVQPASEFAAGQPSFSFPLRTGDEAFDAALLDEFTRGFPRITVDGLNSMQIEVRVPRRHGGMISGQITGANAVPAPAASVSILRKLNNGLKVIVSARSAPNGDFRIPRLPAGDYFVRAIALGERETVDNRELELPSAVYFPAAADLKDAVPVTVLPDQETARINISLEIHRLATVSGLLKMRKTGMPLANVRVNLIGDQQQHFVTSDSEGRWKIPHVASGKYSLTTGTMGVPAPPGAQPEAGPFVHKYQQLTVGENDIADLVIEHEEGGRVSGTVIVEGIAVNKPSSITIIATSAAGDGQNSAGARVNSDGSFLVTGVPLGTINVRAGVFPFNEYVTKSIRWNGVDLMKKKLEVAEGSDISNVVVVLAPVGSQQP
jgi:Carboxypeptidase regulatory-like domain